VAVRADPHHTPAVGLVGRVRVAAVVDEVRARRDAARREDPDAVTRAVAEPQESRVRAAEQLEQPDALAVRVGQGRVRGPVARPQRASPGR
jgi:hypothetical protein